MARKTEDQSVELPQKDDTVLAKTGRGWEEWFSLLDEAEAVKMNHTDMVKLLASRAPDVDAWWAQTIVVGYERARGLRQKHEKAGGFSANASKTIAAPVEDLFEAIANDARRAEWLDADSLEVTTATSPKSVRGKWRGASRVAFYLTAKGDDKSQVAVDHTGLSSPEEVAAMKQFWKERLADLAARLAG